MAPRCCHNPCHECYRPDDTNLCQQREIRTVWTLDRRQYLGCADRKLERHSWWCIERKHGWEVLQSDAQQRVSDEHLPRSYGETNPDHGSLKSRQVRLKTEDALH